MPRTSAAALAVVRPRLKEDRPRPPAELSEEEALEWRSVVDALPPDWFTREQHQILVQYCRHVVRARVYTGMIRELLQEGTPEHNSGMAKLSMLNSMAVKESAAILRCARALRMTNINRWQPVTAHRKASNPNAARKEWDYIA